MTFFQHRDFGKEIVDQDISDTHKYNDAENQAVRDCIRFKPFFAQLFSFRWEHFTDTVQSMFLNFIRTIARK